MTCDARVKRPSGWFRSHPSAGNLTSAVVIKKRNSNILIFIVSSYMSVKKVMSCFGRNAISTKLAAIQKKAPASEILLQELAKATDGRRLVCGS